MPIPTHDSSCVTKAIPINCPDCKAAVFFFKCNCGSRVIFDELGYPWQIHNCRQRVIREQLQLLVGFERMTDEEIFNKIDKNEKLSGQKISDEIYEIIENVLGKRKYTFNTKEVLPDDSISDVSGRIMEFNREVNLLKKFGYDTSSEIALKLLGELGKGHFGEIKLRENPNTKNESMEFSILVKRSYYLKNNLKIGDYILGEVEIANHAKGIVFLLVDHKVY